MAKPGSNFIFHVYRYTSTCEQKLLYNQVIITQRCLIKGTFTILLIRKNVYRSYQPYGNTHYNPITSVQ